MSGEYIKEQFLERLMELPHTLHANGGREYKLRWSPRKLEYVSFETFIPLASFKGDDMDNIERMEEFLGQLKTKRYDGFIRQLESMSQQVKKLEGKYGIREQRVLSGIRELVEAMESLKECYDKTCHDMTKDNKAS